MKDLIKCIKLMKYSLQVKMITILAIIFFIAGILFEIADFSQGGSYSIAALYLALTGIYFYQLVFSTTVSKLIQSSPFKKKLQTWAPVMITLIASLLIFTIYVIIRCIRITPEFIEENDTSYANGYSTILFMALCLFIFFVYSAFSYKSYIFSIILISFSVVGLIFFGQAKDIFALLSEKLLSGNSPVIIILVSYIIILLGAAIGYAFSLAMYKKDISEIAVRYALKQAQSK